MCGFASGPESFRSPWAGLCDVTAHDNRSPLGRLYTCVAVCVVQLPGEAELMAVVAAAGGGGVLLCGALCFSCPRSRLSSSSRYLPGSHVRDPIHIVRPSPTIAPYAASRHSYRPRTVRSTVIGPTTMPLFKSPPHIRLRLST